MISKNTKPKRKRCKQCKKLFQPQRQMQPCCSPKCAVEYVKKPSNKKDVLKNASEADRKEARQKLKQLSMKDRSKALRAAQKAFNAFIRERDKELPCISCQRHHTGQYHAGHYKTRGAHPELAYEELNCHKQCSACNNHLSGNLVNYRINLIDKIGQDKVDWLEGSHPSKKYTVDELWQIEADYKVKLKELQGD